MRVGDIADYVRGVAATSQPREGSDSPRLDEGAFKREFRSQFHDRAFEPLAPEHLPRGSSNGTRLRSSETHSRELTLPIDELMLQGAG